MEPSQWTLWMQGAIRLEPNVDLKALRPDRVYAFSWSGT